MHTNDKATDMHWNRHVGLTYTDPETAEDGIEFGAVAADGRKYRFHLELNALKALNAEAFYDDDVIDRFHAHQKDIETCCRPFGDAERARQPDRAESRLFCRVSVAPAGRPNLNAHRRA